MVLLKTIVYLSSEINSDGYHSDEHGYRSTKYSWAFFGPILKDMAVAIPYTLMPSGESLLISKRDVQPSPFFALWPGRFRNLEINSVCKTKSLSLNLGEHSVLRTISVRK